MEFQGYDPNGQIFGPNQNGYQGVGTVLESLQTGQPGSFTKATWNMPSRYILVETPNMPIDMGRRSICSFRCPQFGHYAGECPNNTIFVKLGDWTSSKIIHVVY